MRLCTFVFTLIGAAICFFHYFGYDPRNMILFSLSVPLWFVPIFGDIRNVNLFVAYLLTIGSWAVLGYIVDRVVQRTRGRRRGSF